MQLIKQTVSEPIISLHPEITVEDSGRICYKSKPKDEEERNDFIRKLIKRGHHSVIEHSCCTFKFVTSRAIANEIVRHRLASYSQESTRYCQYTGRIAFIIPFWFKHFTTGIYDEKIGLQGLHNGFSMQEQVSYDAERLYINSCIDTEEIYKKLIAHGLKAEEARGRLSLDLATILVMTANFREWRHVFKLRCSKEAHPEIRELMSEARDIIIERHPVFFEDLVNEN